MSLRTKSILALVLVIVPFVLVGCGSGDSGGQMPDNNQIRTSNPGDQRPVSGSDGASSTPAKE